MELEDQVVSLELSKKLKELGVKQESIFSWLQYPHTRAGEPNEWELSYTKLPVDNPLWVSAFTVAELGEMLKQAIKNDDEFGPGLPYWYDKWGKPCWQWEMRRFTKNSDGDCAETEADARAKMLVYLIEDKLISIPN